IHAPTTVTHPLSLHDALPICQRAAAHVGWRVNDFARRVIGAPRGLARIVVVSVASSRTNGLLAAAARRRAGIKPEFFASARRARSEEHTSELQSLTNLLCPLP